ncbi:MAG: 3-hydroxyacyl-CoA dehydrogenase NAD-binding domain-containing protein [Thermoleophilia bacterium]
MTADETAGTPEPGRVVVIGAGLMGVGISQVFALAGHEVRVVEIDAACRARAVPRLTEQLETLVEHGLVDARGAAAAIERVSLTDDLGAAVDPGEGQPPLLVIEAVSENLALKRRLFAAVDRRTPPSTLLCSNTSGLSITAIAAETSRPERVCGAHFWNPPHLIPLVEVVKGEGTAESTLRATSALLRAAGKVPVVVRRDIPGFIGNRLLHALQREAMSLVANGVASAEDVDLVVTQGFGRRLGVIGPLAVCDLAGLDLVLEVDNYLLRDLESSPAPSPLLVELVAQGHLGVKSGRGFLLWDEETVRAAVAKRDAALIRALQAG